MKGKKSRLNNKNKNKTDAFVVDRISDLPDSILGHILSFLPTEKAVATSILSKRWKFSWVSVHSLDFSFSKEPGFVPFVNRVLLLIDPGWLNKFGLHYRYSRCCPRCITPEVVSWINTAIARNVHELNLCVGTMDLPQSLFCCESLRSLNLQGFIRINVKDTGPVFLPRLESLEMNYISIRDKEDCETFFSGCPVLKNLKLYIGAYCGGVGYNFTCVISSAYLRHLEVYFENSLRFKLKASSLEYLKLVGGPINDIFVEKSLRFLVTADINLDLYEREFPVNSIIEAVRALDRVKFLSLSDSVMQALSRATISLSAEFKRLVKLEAKTYFSSLLDVIQSSDNLEDLTIEQFSDNYLDGQSEWTTPGQLEWTSPLEVPRCLSNSLKKVELKDYEGWEDEQEMIRYVLKYASVLETMRICCFEEYGKKLELLQEICQFPRKSPACEVQFCMYSSKRQLKPLVLISRKAGEMVYLPYSLRDRSTLISRSTR